MKDEKIQITTELNNLDKDIGYEAIITELENAYNSYVQNKTIAISASMGAIITLNSMGLTSMFGPGGLLIAVGVGCIVGVAREAYKKELLQLLSTSTLGNVEEIEKYYKQLPQDIREEWINTNAFSKLADHLKTKFPEDKIYNIDKIDYSTLDEWVALSGDDNALPNLVNINTNN